MRIIPCIFLALAAGACSMRDAPATVSQPVPLPAEMLLEATAVADGASYNRGKALVEANCTGCHARFAGEASVNPASPSFATLFRHYPPEYIAEAFAEGVFTGHNEMPAFEFSPAEIDDLIIYLTALEKYDVGP